MGGVMAEYCHFREAAAQCRCCDEELWRARRRGGGAVAAQHHGASDTRAGWMTKHEDSRHLVTLVASINLGRVADSNRLGLTTSQQCRSVDSVQSRLLIAAAVLDSPAKRPMFTEGTEIGRQRTNEHFLTT
jgi:hypothetical protein